MKSRNVDMKIDENGDLYMVDSSNKKISVEEAFSDQHHPKEEVK